MKDEKQIYMAQESEKWEDAIYERIESYQRHGWKDWFATCLLQMTLEKDFTVDITTEYLTPFMSAYSKALQRMIDEGRLSVSGAIQSSFGGQVFGRM